MCNVRVVYTLQSNCRRGGGDLRPESLLDDEDAVDTLVDILSDRDNRVRLYAAQHIGR